MNMKAPALRGFFSIFGTFCLLLIFALKVGAESDPLADRLPDKVTKKIHVDRKTLEQVKAELALVKAEITENKKNKKKAAKNSEGQGREKQEDFIDTAEDKTKIEQNSLEILAKIKSKSIKVTRTKSKDKSGNIEASEALEWMKNGNYRFTHRKYLRRDGQGRRTRQSLVVKQRPHTIVLAPADSRVPPEIIFDQKLGEIFVVRSAGNVLDGMTIAGMEKAIQSFGCRLILILGNENNETLRFALKNWEPPAETSPFLKALLADIHPRLQEFKGKKVSKNLKKEVWAHIKGVKKDILTRSAFINQKASEGKLTVRTAFYNLATGVVDFK